MAESPVKKKPIRIGKPRMTDAEIGLLSKLLSDCRCYCEFGSGGSTLMALRALTKYIVTIESDAAWLAALGEHDEVAAARASGRYIPVHADIGVTGAWGYPTSDDTKQRWPGYAAAPWPVWDRLGEAPDLILVDGRFRVACCLESFAWVRARSGDAFTKLRLLIHDVEPKRAHYQEALSFFSLRCQVDKLCWLEPRGDAPMDHLEPMLARLRFDPR